MKRAYQIAKRVFDVLSVVAVFLTIVTGVLSIGYFLTIFPAQITRPKLNLAAFGSFIYWTVVIIVVCGGTALIGYGTFRIVRLIAQKASSSALKRVLSVAAILIVILGGAGAFTLFLPIKGNHVTSPTPRPGQLLWTAQDDGSRYNPPSVFNGIAYVGETDSSNNTYLYALHASDGSVTWKVQTLGVIVSPPIVANGFVFSVCVDNNNFYHLDAFHANDGSPAWDYQFDGLFGSQPIIIGKNVYVGSAALHVADGSPIWQLFPTSFGLTPPIIANGFVYYYASPYYVGMEDYLFALHASDGTLAWKYPLGGEDLNISDSPPTVANGLVYTPIGDQILALHASDGSLAWRFVGNDTIYRSPTVANGLVYGESDNGYLYALHASNGSLAWKYQTGGTFANSPTVVNGIVFVGSANNSNTGYLYALHASDGSLAWKYQTQYYVDAYNGGSSLFLVNDFSYADAPAVVNGLVYEGSDTGYLYALHASDGSLAWKYQTGGQYLGSPAVTNRSVFIFSDELYAIST